MFEAEQQQAEDALDAFQAVPASRGGVLSHRGQPAGASQAAAAEVEAATASAAEADDEARRLQAQCEQQAAELAAVREQARRSEREARCTLNLQRFKYELLLDLVRSLALLILSQWQGGPIARHAGKRFPKTAHPPPTPLAVVHAGAGQ